MLSARRAVCMCCHTFVLILSAATADSVRQLSQLCQHLDFKLSLKASEALKASAT